MQALRSRLAFNRKHLNAYEKFKNGGSPNPLLLLLCAPHGKVPEWPNGTDSKSVVLAIVPRVRIPVFPPYIEKPRNSMNYGAFSCLLKIQAAWPGLPANQRVLMLSSYLSAISWQAPSAWRFSRYKQSMQCPDQRFVRLLLFCQYRAVAALGFGLIERGIRALHDDLGVVLRAGNHDRHTNAHGDATEGRVVVRHGQVSNCFD